MKKDKCCNTFRKREAEVIARTQRETYAEIHRRHIRAWPDKLVADQLREAGKKVVLTALPCAPNKIKVSMRIVDAAPGDDVVEVVKTEPPHAP